MSIKHIWSFIVTAVVALSISACGDKPTPAPTPATSPKVEAPAPKPAEAPTAKTEAPSAQPKAEAPVAAVTLVAGKDYQILKTPQPAADSASIEVLEFFWYGCPHCDHLQPALHEWLKRKPADVAFRRQPAAFQDSWVQLARTYYAIEAIDATDKLHGEIFNAIHRTKTLNPNSLLKDQKPLFELVASKGVDQKKFADAYNSFGVNTKSQRTVDITSAYDITGTPSIVIDGRYLTAPSMMPPKANNTVDYDLFFRSVDQLIAMARKNRGGK
jgi:thiol:disulfide interchange protein DsbA